jgi:translation initiation factor 2 beta subunit (eIF-2beta)/eIF-5
MKFVSFYLKKRMSVCIPFNDEEGDSYSFFAKRRELTNIIKVYETDSKTQKSCGSTYILNAKKIATQLHRHLEDLQNYISIMFDTKVCIGKNQSLQIESLHSHQEIEHCINEYINDYVTCSICTSVSTLYLRRPRLIFCTGCGSFIKPNFF